MKKYEEIFINRIVKSTRVEGFGARYCIWVQGCSIKCPQCSNQDMWNKEKSKIYNVYDVIDDILSQELKIEGITFLGGEPFDQAKPLAVISEKVHEKGYSVITFTGYEYSNLKYSLNTDVQCLLKNTDLLIDGPFKVENIDYSRPWIGSSNQNYIFLSDRYKNKDLQGVKNKFEVSIGNKGQVYINGMGDYKKLISFLKRRIL